MTTYHTGRRYLSAGPELTPGAIALFGVPYDGTTSFRPGARFGPAAIRDASPGLETYSPEQDRDLTDIDLADIGDLDIPTGSPKPVIKEVRRAVADLLQRGVLPLMLGGEHSLTGAAVAAAARAHPDLLLIQLDAHADLRDDYLGERWSHACAMRRCLDALGDDSLLQVGIRSGTRGEFEEMRAAGRFIPPTADDLQRMLQPHAGRPIYLTVDLDIFDPAHLPGTGTPEPGGIDWPTFRDLLAALPGPALVAADVMELAPRLDPTGCSAVWAAKVVREVALKVGEPRL